MKKIIQLVVVMIGTFASCCFAADLNKDVIGRWLESYHAVQDWTKQNQRALQKLEMDAALGGEKGQKLLQNSKLYSEMLNVLKKYKFTSADEWKGVGEQIMLAYGAYQQTSVKSDFSKEVAEIKNDPDMTPDQKATMLRLLQHTRAMADRFASVSEADKSAVSAYVDQITALTQSR